MGFMNDLVSGANPHGLPLLASQLIPRENPQGRDHPIAIGEALLRLSSICDLLKARNTAEMPRHHGRGRPSRSAWVCPPVQRFQGTHCTWFSATQQSTRCNFNFPNAFKVADCNTMVHARSQTSPEVCYCTCADGIQQRTVLHQPSPMVTRRGDGSHEVLWGAIGRPHGASVLCAAVSARGACGTGACSRRDRHRVLR